MRARRRRQERPFDIETIMKYRGYRPWWVKDFVLWLKSHWEEVRDKSEDCKDKD